MKYYELENIKNRLYSGSNKCKVCLFGAGKIGVTWGYDLLVAAGFQVDFYCDNNIEENIEIRNGVKTIAAQQLYTYKDNVIVFITAVSLKNQDNIEEQLRENGVCHVIRVDFGFLTDYMESLLALNNENINEQFKDVLDDAEYLKKLFVYVTGQQLHLDNPKTFNEKIQWLKLYNRNLMYTELVDKYSVKKYVAEKIGERYIIPTLGVYDTFDDIDFDQLPRQFVMKCTHDSASIKICNDKDQFDKNQAKRFFENKLKINYFWLTREFPYKNVKPRIIIEKYMEDVRKKELIDYKFLCFNGKVKLIFTCTERFSKEGLKVTFFDLNWNKMPFERHYPSSKEIIEKPVNYEKMIELAERLSQGIPFVRVDFYEINEQPFFGEMTFSPGGGMEEFTPPIWDEKIGDLIDLSIVFPTNS